MSVYFETVIGLLIAYQIKHFLCDYPLQGPYMLRKFLPGWGFFLPLLAHAGVHALCTGLIAFLFGSYHLIIPLALLDGTVHFIMDRIKAGPKYMGRWKPLTAQEYRNCYDLSKSHWAPTSSQASQHLRGNTLFWWALGFDQMVHHLTHYLCIYLLMTR
jgi:hypothetical protein